MDTSLLIWKPAVAEALRGREEKRPDVARSSSDPLSRVWEDTSPDLRRLAAALGMRRDQIEDVLQDVWVTAWQRRPAALEGDELRRWLYRVTVNRCRLDHRHRGRWQRVLQAVGQFWPYASSEDATSGAQSKELGIDVERALERLDSSVREMVVLRYFCDFDSRQIGEMLDLPDSTVRSHLRAARRQMARQLANWNDQHER